MSNKTTNIPDFIEPIISCLSYTPEIKSVTFDSTDTIFTVCCTGHIRPCSQVDINGTMYMVKNVLVDNQFTIEGDLTAVIDPVITLSQPYYWHGTTTQTSAELSMINHGSDKYPMVYLNEPFTESFKCDEESCIEREVSIRLFFLDITNFNDWKTEQHYLYAINPMRYLAEEFVNKLKANKLIYSDSISYRIRSHAKIGDVVRDVASLKSLLNDKLSGVELIIDFSVYKDFSCYIC